MDKSKNILDILQLYEFAMAIGTSLDYKTNCDNFLKTLLARKNFSACCIVRKIDNKINSLYCYPDYKEEDKSSGSYDMANGCITGNCPLIFTIDQTNNEAVPFKFNEGIALFFPLSKDTGLFIFDETRITFPERDLNQLLPLIEKFKTSLDACEAFAKQDSLLKRLEVQNQELMDYAQVVSHDLKSPLRNINTIINWIKEDNKESLTTSIISNLSKIDENLERVDRLIEGILKYSTIDKAENNYANVDFEEILDDVINSIGIPSHIAVIVDNKLPVVTIDPIRLKQLLQNIISNAIKSIYEEKGKIKIKTWLSENTIMISISDNGIGIEKKYHEKIFEIFESLDGNSNSAGLGLSIVKKIVEYYNGFIKLESSPGNGTTFNIGLSLNLTHKTPVLNL